MNKEIIIVECHLQIASGIQIISNMRIIELLRGSLAVHLLVMVTESQLHYFNDGESALLECSFQLEQYSMFDYPVIWRKSQLSEETQMNVMGSLNEPFVSNNRFEVTFTSLAPVYILELSILGTSRVS